MTERAEDRRGCGWHHQNQKDSIFHYWIAFDGHLVIPLCVSKGGKKTPLPNSPSQLSRNKQGRKYCKHCKSLLAEEGDGAK